MPSTVLGAGDSVKERRKRPKSLPCDASICLSSHTEGTTDGGGCFEKKVGWVGGDGKCTGQR